MINEMKMYGCDCDGKNCEEFWQDPETGSIAHLDPETTKEQATEDDWLFADDGKHIAQLVITQMMMTL